MNLTTEQIEQILAGAPDGATHYAIIVNEYIKQSEKGVMVWDGGEWDYEIVSYLGVHNLSDLREIITLRKRVEELEAQVPKWVKLEDGLPEYGIPVLLKIQGFVQEVTFMRDGSDDSPDWFEPFHYEDKEHGIYISHDAEIEWMPLPPKGESHE